MLTNYYLYPHPHTWIFSFGVTWIISFLCGISQFCNAPLNLFLVWYWICCHMWMVIVVRPSFVIWDDSHSVPTEFDFPVFTSHYMFLAFAAFRFCRLLLWQAEWLPSQGLQGMHWKAQSIRTASNRYQDLLPIARYQGMFLLLIDIYKLQIFVLLKERLMSL